MAETKKLFTRSDEKSFYLPSKSVKVFPCSYRGNYEIKDATTTINKRFTFDPEARLNTEYNYTNSYSKIGGVDSYIINISDSEDQDLLKFVLYGYYFEIKNWKTYFNDITNLYVYLQVNKKIELSAENTADSQRNTEILSSWENSAELLDFKDDKTNEYYFSGLLLTKNDYITAYTAKLCLKLNSDWNQAAFLTELKHGTAKSATATSYWNSEDETFNLNTANGVNSFATGESTKASGKNSFTIGSNTEASGENSFTTGKNTKASGNSAYAGGIGTIASQEGQTVVGKYNVKDTAGEFIVGTGTKDEDRKNSLVVNNNEVILNNTLKIKASENESEYTTITPDNIEIISENISMKNSQKNDIVTFNETDSKLTIDNIDLVTINTNTNGGGKVGTPVILSKYINLNTDNSSLFLGTDTMYSYIKYKNNSISLTDNTIALYQDGKIITLGDTTTISTPTTINNTLTSEDRLIVKKNGAEITGDAQFKNNVEIIGNLTTNINTTTNKPINILNTTGITTTKAGNIGTNLTVGQNITLSNKEKDSGTLYWDKDSIAKLAIKNGNKETIFLKANNSKTDGGITLDASTLGISSISLNASNTNISGAASIGSTLTSENTLTVKSGGAEITGDFTLKGSSTIDRLVIKNYPQKLDKNITLTGSTKINGATTITGTTTLSSNIKVGLNKELSSEKNSIMINTNRTGKNTDKFEIKINDTVPFKLGYGGDDIVQTKKLRVCSGNSWNSASGTINIKDKAGNIIATETETNIEAFAINKAARLDNEHVAFGIYVTNNNTDNTNGRKFSITYGGAVTATSYNATSDKRLKENIKEYKPEKSILELPIYKYDFIEGTKNQIGCLAQDLQEICPEIVDKDQSGYLSIKESKIVYLLLEEIKKLNTRVSELERR